MTEFRQDAHLSWFLAQLSCSMPPHCPRHLEVIKGAIASLILSTDRLQQRGEPGGDNLPGTAAIPVEARRSAALELNMHIKATIVKIKFCEVYKSQNKTR